MSVFNDFQRLWMQRFPQSSLSDAWEQDVRASLERHKIKIAELSKELEQETLYVEYLERLLSDVEKYRESGGDPTTLFEAATNPGAADAANAPSGSSNNVTAATAANGATCSVTGNANAGVDKDFKSSLNLREASTASSGGKDKDRLSLSTDNKYTQNTQNDGGGGGGSGGGLSSAPPTGKRSMTEHSFEREDKKDSGNEKDANGALQQCITELAASIGTGAHKANEQRTTAPNDNKQEAGVATASGSGSGSGSGGGDADKEQSLSQSKPLRKSTSHFVTVIEVKEAKDKDIDDAAASTTTSSTTTTVNDTSSSSAANSSSSTSTPPSTFARHYPEQRNKAVEATAPPLSPSLAMSTSVSASEAKKKMPPRPPPKNVRRVEPPTIPSQQQHQLSSSPKRETPYVGSTMPLPPLGANSSGESPGSSLERNIKPSDILRQKSSESLESKYTANRKTTPELSKLANTPELMEELGRKMVGKTDSLEHAKRSDALSTSNGGSLGRTASTPGRALTPLAGRGNNIVGASPTGSLSKTAKLAAVDSSSTSSLEKKSRASLQASDAETARSKESLASQGISEVIKSYESVSSLSSDSAKAANAQQADNEPYYDSVPLDNGDGEYVFIKPGRTGSSSSRDDLSTPGSTLPMAQLSSQASVTDPESPGRTSNYVNIDYFIQSNETRSSSLDSDGEYEGPPILRTISHDEQQTTMTTTSSSSTSQTPGALRKNLVSAILLSGNARGAKIRSILSSIIHSETIYVECLNKMIQYKRAIHATLGTSQPVIKEDEENTIFFKIDELHEVHTAFLGDLKTIVAHEGGDVLIGEPFKRLADMFDLYSAFLHNYGQAIDTVKKCSANNPQFKKIVSTIVVNLQTEQSLTLEDLLHKPVARVQINALVFNDLLRETPANHPDHQPLKQAQKNIQIFLNQFNVVNQRLPTESNRNLRRMVRNSFIVELVDGHRKLRHLFLFNDVIACAKYKALGRDRIDYELKWFIPLKDVNAYEESDLVADLKESSPANISQVKRNLRSVRDQLILESNGVRTGDKYRRKLADLESQLVLATPNLVLRLGNKANNKTMTFFLSSDFERTQWMDSIMSLKQKCNLPGANTINSLEVTAFIVAMQKGMKTEMGSYLMRNTNDESLLVGDLHMGIQGLQGLEQAADLYICIEVDSYGHYFRKATTKMICRSQCPLWNESFMLELEGSQNVRILLYEDKERPLLRAKHILKLSRSWLTETTQTRSIKLSETLELNASFRFVPGELCRATTKPGALFGAKMSQVLKREKRDIPFIISACIREVERRGMLEVGCYRVSGSASDLAKLKKAFESDAYEAEQLLREVDIHSVTGILKTFLRELPEALFSDLLYPRFFETFSAFSNNNEATRINELLKVYEELPQANKSSINLILDHLIRVHEKETDNKMSLHNLAMVFGPTLLRPGQTQVKQKDPLAASTVDVMAQAGILYCFLQARIKKD
ncbi:active breakpoint cluster region-related protein isoform X1 [Drosophila sulfurigaster albostrigata]|uniref:active breakpoint cluster region-related protein isoform X1 n=1 Tax=Drosophila sulfurigaster albostrigata TaxID=89887 RepID=UPI002D21E1FD|nr:active breakpoint cluster region-related protein isoform X1 [Drosophila sulfurigaster albostrigata]